MSRVPRLKLTWNMLAIALLLPSVVAIAAIAWKPLWPERSPSRDRPSLDCEQLEIEGRRVERFCQRTVPPTPPQPLPRDRPN